MSRPIRMGRIIIDMATTPKRRSPTRGKLVPVPVERSALSKPFLRFYHSGKLRTKTLAVLTTVEKCQDPTAHCGALAEVILDLIDSGLDYYFLRSLKAAKASFITQQSAAFGLAGVQKVMGTVVRNILGRMDGPQLLSLCGSIRQFML